MRPWTSRKGIFPQKMRNIVRQENCKVRGPVHFSARTDEIHQKSLPENMDLTPSRWTLQFSWIVRPRGRFFFPFGI